MKKREGFWLRLLRRLKREERGIKTEIEIPDYYAVELDLITEHERGKVRKRLVEEHQPALLLFRRKDNTIMVVEAEITNNGHFLKTKHHGMIRRGGVVYKIREKAQQKLLGLQRREK